MPRNGDIDHVISIIGRDDARRLREEIDNRQDNYDVSAATSYITGLFGLAASGATALGLGIFSLLAAFSSSSVCSYFEDLEDLYTDIYTDIVETETWMGGTAKKYYVLKQTIRYTGESGSRPGKWHNYGLPTVVETPIKSS